MHLPVQQEGFLAYVRVFEYILVIIASVFLGIVKKRSYIYYGNLLVAAFLCFNAIQYIYGVPNSPAFQITATIFIGLWALSHMLELLRKN
jgi:hypothetical protein